MDTLQHWRGGRVRGLALIAVLASTVTLAQEPPPAPPDNPPQDPGIHSGMGGPRVNTPAAKPPPPPDETPPSRPSDQVAKDEIQKRDGPPSRPVESLAKSGAFGAQWGAFKTDKCTRSGYVQKSAILHGIQGSWEDACYHTGATIDGHPFDHPSRCVNTGIAMWGEFDVPSQGCTPRWEGLKADACRGVGIRQHSARLMNIKDIDWNDACMQTDLLIKGVYYEQPTRCRTTKASGQWGEFDVLDPSCR